MPSSRQCASYLISCGSLKSFRSNWLARWPLFNDTFESNSTKSYQFQAKTVGGRGCIRKINTWRRTRNPITLVNLMTRRFDNFFRGLVTLVINIKFLINFVSKRERRKNRNTQHQTKRISARITLYQGELPSQPVEYQR